MESIINTKFNNTPLGERGKRIHPHKFLLWIAIGSICMMFAGLTSAYIVKRNQSDFKEFALPVIFWFSTAVILLSSVTIQVAVRSFKAREMRQYRLLMAVTALLGLVFAGMQVIGFMDLKSHGIDLIGFRSNASASFILVIVGLHAVHVLGGVVALLIMFIKAYWGKTKNYSSVPIEVMANYWHFVDVLWIYLLIFFIWIK
jgi:cytochrome c oxidase subunit 3